ncbi:IS1096 element passenger TnpR family protein [Cupriavidus necator]
MLIPEHMTLGQLHAVIQAVMGWTDEHLHQFTMAVRRSPRGRSPIFHGGNRADAERIRSARARGLRLRV